MAPSHRSVLVALLVALAVSLQQPSAAAFSIPCNPYLPKIPFIPCYDAPALPPLKLPTECWTPLTRLIPCAGFITTSGVSSPPPECCDGFRSVVDHAAPCFCHYTNGEIGKMIPGTLNFTRMFAIPEACGCSIRLEGFTDCPAEVPPMTRPSPPPSTSPPAA